MIMIIRMEKFSKEMKKIYTNIFDLFPPTYQSIIKNESLLLFLFFFLLMLNKAPREDQQKYFYIHTP